MSLDVEMQAVEQPGSIGVAMSAPPTLEARGAMSPSPAAASMLADAQGRHMRYLRMSITDRCNFRCGYCSPASWGGKKDLLTTDEIVRIAELFVGLGIERIRLTGGEPLLRPDLVEIVRRLRALTGLRHIALTTNASRLVALARPLREAGLDHLNISLDTLNEETFRSISARGDFAQVLAGIDAVVDEKFASAKLNTVVMKDVNALEVPALVAYAHARGLVPRFIELMPFGKGTGVATKVLVEQLEAAGFAMTPAPSNASIASGPAQYFSSATGLIGFVSPMTQNFCGGCNRVRVASNGDLRACLGGREQAPLSTLIRGGATNAELEAAIRRALGMKAERHHFNDPDAKDSLLSMMGIGG